jgi:integrase
MGKWYRKARPLREDPDPFSLEELHQVEAVCRERWPEWYEFILFMGRTGVRVGEAIAMQTPDLDLEGQQAVIRRNMPIHRELGTPKSIASARIVDLSPQLVQALESRILRRKAADLAAGISEVSEWLFATSRGNPPDYSRFAKVWNRLQARAKVRRRRPHDLRHTYATLNLLAGKPLAWVSAQLGHKSQEITLRIYAHWIKGAPSGATDVLDSKIGIKTAIDGDEIKAKL